MKTPTHEETKLIRKFLLTLWKLNLNSGPVPYDMYDMLEDLLKDMGRRFYGD